MLNGMGSLLIGRQTEGPFLPTFKGGLKAELLCMWHH